MTYGSLKFDNEVINALYSVDSKQYWNYYLQKFYTQWCKYDDAAQSKSGYADIARSEVDKIESDLESLAKDLATAQTNDPLVKWIKDTLADIEAIKMITIKTDE